MALPYMKLLTSFNITVDSFIEPPWSLHPHYSIYHLSAFIALKNSISEFSLCVTMCICHLKAGVCQPREWLYPQQRYKKKFNTEQDSKCKL